MSPEQAVGQPATTHSDVYSFGLTLFEMLTGRAPHQGRSLADLLVKLQQPDMADELVLQVAEGDRPLLAATLAYAPQDRPTMQAVKQQLENK